MFKKFPARKNESNLKDIHELLSELKRDLKVVEAKSPYNNLLSSSLELAIKKASIAENRLSAEGFIDGLYVSQVISYLKEKDPNITSFTVAITKSDNSLLTLVPYQIDVIGN